MISNDYGEKRKAERIKREKLFKKSRPFVRPLDPEKDMWVLWAAYDLKSFPNLPEKLNPSQFTQLIRNTVKSRSAALVIEDDCKYFKNGRGPVCLLLVDNYGWRIEPFVDFFFWATPRIKLRANVAFFQKIRHDSAVGVCLVKAHEKYSNLFNRMKDYGVLSRCGKIPYGYPDGDEYLYQIRGKNAGVNGIRRNGEVQRDDRVQRTENPSPARPVPDREPEVLRQPERENSVGSSQQQDSDDSIRESSPAPVVPVMPVIPASSLREVRLRDWA